MSIRISHDAESSEIYSAKEKFKIIVTDREEGDTLEQSQISVGFNGPLWAGSIQDFAAIRSYAMNAFNLISSYGGENVVELVELKQLLFHFIKDVKIPPATPERSKELALISCVMTHNLFDDMMKSSRTQGMVHCYDIIAGWAAEFYDKYKFHTEWEDVPADFPGATGWEDSICQFADKKFQSL